MKTFDDSPQTESPKYSIKEDVIPSGNTPVPRWLLYSYIFFILWGFVTLYYFWNGSHGWLDPGSWHKLQEAARTVYIGKDNGIY